MRKNKKNFDFVGTHQAAKGTDRHGSRTVGFRSKLEHAIMLILDQSADVARWTYEFTDVVAVGRSTSHRPDFLVEMVDGTLRVVEGKCHKLTELYRADEELKKTAAQTWCDSNGADYMIVWYSESGWCEVFDGPRSFAFLVGSRSYHEEVAAFKAEQDRMVAFEASIALRHGQARDLGFVDYGAALDALDYDQLIALDLGGLLDTGFLEDVDD